MTSGALLLTAIPGQGWAGDARVAFGRASTGVQGHGGGTGSYARRVGIRLPRVGDWRRGPVCLIPGIVTTMRRNTGSLGQAAIGALTSRFPHMEVAAAPVRRDTITLRGLEHLVVAPGSLTSLS